MSDGTPFLRVAADRIGAPGSARIAGKNAIPGHQRRQLVLNHPDRREDGCHSKANCASSGFESHSTGWKGSIWGIPVQLETYRMPRITMIETKLMSRAVAWGLAILLAGAVPWPAQADYPGKYLEVCLQDGTSNSNSKWVWIASETGYKTVYFKKPGNKTFDYSSGTKTEIDPKTSFNILHIRTINKLMDDDWNPGGVRSVVGKRLYCQVMWKD